MDEKIKTNEKDISKKYSWVYSLPFFPKLVKKIKIILLLYNAYKNKLIKLIRQQRINAINKIINAYKKYKIVNELKKEYFIRKIISERKNAIILIQRNIKYYLKKLKLKEIIRKDKGCYTIICNKCDVAKICVKIFTDYDNSDKNMILPMKYCPIRNYFFFPIPKTKFVLADKDNKIVHFYFIHNGNVFYDENQYKLIDFYGKKVHEINFSNYGKNDKINKNNPINKNISINIDEEIDGLSYKYLQRQKSSINNKEHLLSFSSDDELEKKSSRKVSKDSNGCKKKKFQRRKSKGKTCKLKKPNCLKIISILKERNTEGRKRSCTIHIKRVQFGTVTFSY